MISLRATLIEMSNMVAGLDERARIRAAMFVAAEVTISRIREVAPNYDLGGGVPMVETELRDDGSRSAMVPPKKLYRDEPVAVVPIPEPESL